MIFTAFQSVHENFVNQDEVGSQTVTKGYFEARTSHIGYAIEILL